MDKQTIETIKTAEKWVELSNDNNLEELAKVTDDSLELVGPKGTGIINHQELGEWMKRANLKLTTIHQYAKNSFTIFEQQGTWLNDDGTIKGQAIVFTVFRVVNRKVTFLARMDNKEAAFDLSGLSDVNKVNQNSL